MKDKNNLKSKHQVIKTFTIDGESYLSILDVPTNNKIVYVNLYGDVECADLINGKFLVANIIIDLNNDCFDCSHHYYHELNF